METLKKQQEITVSGTSPGPYTIDPVDDINMRGQGQGVIEWDVTTPGWTFAPTNGIYFKKNADQMQNTPGQVPGHPERWQANDLNTNQDVSLVLYGINLVGPGGAPASLDPAIINGH